MKPEGEQIHEKITELWKALCSIGFGVMVYYLINLTQFKSERSFIKGVCSAGSAMFLQLLLRVLPSNNTLLKEFSGEAKTLKDLFSFGTAECGLRAAGFVGKLTEISKQEIGKQWLTFLFHVKSNIWTSNWVNVSGFWEGWTPDTVAVHKAKYRAESDSPKKVFIVEKQREICKEFKQMMCDYCQSPDIDGFGAGPIDVGYILKREVDRIIKKNKTVYKELSLDFGVLPDDQSEVVWINSISKKRTAQRAKVVFDLELAKHYRQFHKELQRKARKVQNRENHSKCIAALEGGCPRGALAETH